MTTPPLLEEEIESFLQAPIESLEFAGETLPSHWDRPEERCGYKLVRVLGRPLPAWIRLSYVVGCSNAKPFVYVVLQGPASDSAPDIHDVSSVHEAKTAILRALRSFAAAAHAPTSKTGE